MEQNMTSLQLPHDFGFCMTGDCERSNRCLRHQAWLLTDGQKPFLSVLNPRHIASAYGNACNYFIPYEKQRFAKGMRHIYDNLPTKQAEQIKNGMLRRFGKTRYYRFYRGDQFISPEEQRYIKELFEACGIAEEPCYESYHEDYLCPPRIRNKYE
ncbi:DUF6078 family protein [Bacteroides pyogenes]|uniref:DUF6078 family protein n=1 Tax=Bacteroides pyogenes TaxID=310300 RepID=UPI001BACE725|nr:DUF6078 family protein [Bacteroides pyogenes]MBR8704997.1 hypothetical protein [Bacteroides pyogenes]MCE9105933.1 hypothetical protein [Bacteroides pyogenes]MDY4249205.1 DUF6078 family protein [Bacteroides pyogenes]